MMVRESKKERKKECRQKADESLQKSRPLRTNCDQNMTCQQKYLPSIPIPQDQQLQRAAPNYKMAEMFLVVAIVRGHKL